jgi:hypothetical protein
MLRRHRDFSGNGARAQQGADPGGQIPRYPSAAQMSGGALRRTSAPRSAGDWRTQLLDDPLPWLLSWERPEVRAATLVRLLDRPLDDPEVLEAQREAVLRGPIAAILEAQDPRGWWTRAGSGYAPKYTGSAWQLITLDQLGAPGSNPGVRRGCTYLLDRVQTRTGGFGASTAQSGRPRPSSAIHCLHGNLLRAFIGFGLTDDPRVRSAIHWSAAAITGEEPFEWQPRGTSGPGFQCVANTFQACAWGAVKQGLALARLPEADRTPMIQNAMAATAQFLLSRDPAVADYPMPWKSRKPSAAWFKPGFPSGYITDILQNLEALVGLGHAHDARLRPAVEWLTGLQGQDGRWNNLSALNGWTTVDIETQGDPSPWVTLRACTVLRDTYPAGSRPGG